MARYPRNDPSRSIRSSGLAAAVAALTLTLSTCAAGPVASPGSSGSTPAGVAAFHDQVRLICRDMKNRGEALNTELVAAENPDTLIGGLGQMAALVAEAAVKLRALPLPPGAEAAVTAAIDALGRAGRETTRLAEVLQTGDAAGISQAYDRQRASQRASDQAAAAAGLPDCVLG